MFTDVPGGRESTHFLTILASGRWELWVISGCWHWPDWWSVRARAPWSNLTMLSDQTSDSDSNRVKADGAGWLSIVSASATLFRHLFVLPCTPMTPLQPQDCTLLPFPSALEARRAFEFNPEWHHENTLLWIWSSMGTSHTACEHGGTRYQEHRVASTIYLSGLCCSSHWPCPPHCSTPVPRLSTTQCGWCQCFVVQGSQSSASWGGSPTSTEGLVYPCAWMMTPHG